MKEVTLTLAGKERKLQLQAPKSFALAHDVAGAVSSNWRRAFAAALGACWMGPGRPKASYAGCDYSVGAYGGKVIDELVEQGYNLSEVLAAGAEAFSLLTAGLLSEAEVKAEEDFTDGPAEAPTS